MTSVAPEIICESKHFVVRREHQNCSIRVLFIETEHLFYQYPAITEKFCATKPVPDNCIFVHIPWATLIDRIRLNRVEKEEIEAFFSELALLLAQTTDLYQLPLYTVCQHVRHSTLREQWLRLGFQKVYLCHYTTAMKAVDSSSSSELIFDAVPLYAVNVWDKQRSLGIAETPKPPKNRSLLFSFIGSSKGNELNPIRKRILSWQSTSRSPQFIVCDTKIWFFQDLVYDKANKCVQRPSSVVAKKSLLNKQAESVERYNRVLCDSVFSLCPVGSGPNTIRLTESLCVGSIPVIIADEFPAECYFRFNDIQPSDFCVQIRYSDACLQSASSFIAKLNSIDDEKRKKMHTNAIEVGKRLFEHGLVVQA